MQCGFALLEAGAVRAKNVTNVLLKNFLDARELFFHFDLSLLTISYNLEAISYRNTSNLYNFELQLLVW